ncbi:MAG: SDR family oxidoreductase [Halobacteriota archaeon]
MKILITGGFGYLGGRLAQYLGKIFPKKDIRLLVRRNGQDIPSWAESYDIVKGDVLDDSSLPEACKDIDVIIHLAALNEIESEKYPMNALKVNGEGTLRLLNAAIASKVDKFIYFSTFHVYGLNAHGEISENTIPAPVHPYAITHRVAEDFVRMMVQKKKIGGIILRLSNGFGCPSHAGVNRWTLVFNDFCLQAVLRNKIVLKSAGKQYRDFITLTDISRCVEHLLKIDTDDLIYNLGGNFSISILDVANLIAERCQKVLGTTPEIIIGPDSATMPDEPIIYRTDKLKSIGFQLVSNVEEEIDNTIIFCDRNKEVLNVT